VISNRYRLEAAAGEGGIGAVFRARHLLIDRIVAVKVLRPARRGETHHRDWFLREARAANKVEHDHVVDIYDFGDTEDGLYYLVMEYIKGQPLSHIIAKGPMPIPRATDMMAQTAEALAHAHDFGVVHRDLKSDNIYLTEKGGRKDFVKVIDFGLSSLSTDAKLEPDGAVFGTMEYMSPEQTRGEDATPASDQYALGILYFEMLTGYLPFNSVRRKDLLRLHQEKAPPLPSRYRRDVPKKAEEIILRCLEKEQSKRYPNSHAVHQAFAELSDELGNPGSVNTKKKPKPGPVSDDNEVDGPCVLILDDSKMMLTLYGALLRAAGMQVHTAETILEFDKLLRKVEPSLLLVDVLMPDLDGDEVVPVLRKRYMMDDVPIVLISGMDPGELERRANKAGADGWITKGAAVEGFVDDVQKFLRPCDRPMVLILDDDRSTLTLYGAVLRSAGMRVETAGTLSELEGLMQSNTPTMILCDVVMPHMEGDSAVRFLRARYDLDDTSIILVSGMDERTLSERAKSAGADGHMSKDCSTERFVEEVRNFLIQRARSKGRASTMRKAG